MFSHHRWVRREKWKHLWETGKQTIPLEAKKLSRRIGQYFLQNLHKASSYFHLVTLLPR
jgi:hypothetical protein